ncbi:MAG: hypothetical protein RSA90_08130 [Lachnospiraceae bacterium]
MGKGIKKLILIALVLVLALSMATSCGTKDKKVKKDITEDITKKDEKKEVKNEGKEKTSKPTSENLAGTTFTSSDGKIMFTVPQGTWICTDDSKGYVNFTSEEGAINIVEAPSADIKMPTTREEYLTQLNGTNPDLQCEIESFESGETDGINWYKVVVSYSGENEDKYSVTYGETVGDTIYTASAVLKTDNQDTLASVETSMFGVQVLR